MNREKTRKKRLHEEGALKLSLIPDQAACDPAHDIVIKIDLTVLSGSGRES